MKFTRKKKPTGSLNDEGLKNYRNFMMHIGDSGETNQRDKSQIKTEQKEHTKILMQKSREGKENFQRGPKIQASQASSTCIILVLGKDRRG